jgi:hypothetical protein
VGVVSGTCQIGNLADTNQGNALVNSTNNPSIYEFQLTTAGFVTIVDELGNNGTNAHVNAQLYSLASASSTSGTALGTELEFPDQLGPTGEDTLFSGNLTTGYYAIDTYLDTDGDPRYQANITEAAVSTPEIDPSNGTAAIALLGGVVLIFRGRRTKENTAPLSRCENI